jgi:hypothetical protein
MQQGRTPKIRPRFLFHYCPPCLGWFGSGNAMLNLSSNSRSCAPRRAELHREEHRSQPNCRAAPGIARYRPDHRTSGGAPCRAPKRSGRNGLARRGIATVTGRRRIIILSLGNRREKRQSCGEEQRDTKSRHSSYPGQEKSVEDYRRRPSTSSVTRRATVMARKNGPTTASRLAKLRANGSTGTMSP